MMKQIIAVCALFVFSACGASRKEMMQSVKENNLLQEKQVNDYVFRLQYMPPEGSNADTSLVYFRMNILNASGTPVKGTTTPAFSYGLDSLFAIVSGVDTIIPVDATRIANGTLNGAEYMLVFDKQSVLRNVESKLLFRDWLFTQQYISFPLSGNAINHIDSLSLKI
ncbi:hypothetical protein [Chitinophaga rhizophila]|uniref:Lipoprotein n=1 Tax=Chitinophaga rhizophila TaxID=2866212 RepID=A0ABS7G4W0_9BACT|nr:hypothetical protein [Chitinophaga rhizophila]MBW8682705.1 hypothetical protein [Chitinophaga rhizophila]